MPWGVKLLELVVTDCFLRSNLNYKIKGVILDGRDRVQWEQAYPSSHWPEEAFANTGAVEFCCSAYLEVSKSSQPMHMLEASPLLSQGPNISVCHSARKWIVCAFWFSIPRVHLFHLFFSHASLTHEAVEDKILFYLPGLFTVNVLPQQKTDK